MRLFPKRLPRDQYGSALYLAGRFSAQREQWMLQAKGSVEDRSFYVSLARASHRAYLNTLKVAARLVPT